MSSDIISWLQDVRSSQKPAAAAVAAAGLFTGNSALKTTKQPKKRNHTAYHHTGRLTPLKSASPTSSNEISAKRRKISGTPALESNPFRQAPGHSDTGNRDKDDEERTGSDNGEEEEAQSEAAEPQMEMDETPRPRRQKTINSSSHSSSRSSRSGVSSSRRDFAAMALAKLPVSSRGLWDPKVLPPAVAKLRATLINFGHGHGILGESVKEEILDEEDPENSDLDILRTHQDVYFSPERDALGPTIPYDDVIYQLDLAADCWRYDKPETTWNNEVHLPLLQHALLHRRSGRLSRRLINVTSCMSASIIMEYRTIQPKGRKVDYCIYIKPDYDSQPGMAATIDAYRKHLPLLSINAIDQLDLFARPVAIPIETKRPGEGLDTAKLQAAMWLSAQYAILHRFLDDGDQVPLEPGERKPQLQDFGYLPGIIVQGHIWTLLAATYNGDGIIVWSGIVIGSTHDIFGVYQLMSSLQTLGTWIEKEYWPWLRRVLCRAEAGARLHAEQRQVKRARVN